MSVAPEDDRRMAVRMYSETRLPVEDIANLYGVSRQTIYNWLEEAGLPRRGPAGQLPRPQEDGTVAMERGALIEGQRQIMAQIAALAALEKEVAALRAEQTSQQGGWMAQLVEMRRVLGSIREDVTALRGEQTSQQGGWMAQLVEMRRVLGSIREDVTALRGEQTSRQDLYLAQLVEINSQVGRLGGLIEAWERAVTGQGRRSPKA